MADIARYPFVRHLRGSTTTHVEHVRNGRTVRAGVGASFWFRPTWSRGVARHRPVSGSIEKSIRPAAVAGSVNRKVTVAWTVTSWKSLVRAWNSSGSSRSSTGTSLSTALSARDC